MTTTPHVRPNGIAQLGPDGTRLLMTPLEASKALAISPRKLWSLTASGEIPCVRLGRSVRYSVDDLRNWINVQKKGGAADQ